MSLWTEWKLVRERGPGTLPMWEKDLISLEHPGSTELLSSEVECESEKVRRCSQVTGEGPGPESCSERLIVSLQWGTCFRQTRRVLCLGLGHPQRWCFLPFSLGAAKPYQQSFVSNPCIWISKIRSSAVPCPWIYWNRKAMFLRELPGTSCSFQPKWVLGSFNSVAII